jgi:hypothetical protein
MGDVPRPLPVPDAVTAPFWEGCAGGTLRVQACRDCGHRWLPGSVVCPRCWSDATAWLEASGEGTIFSFAVYHRAYHEAFRPLLPYVVAVVELAEGPRLVSRLVAVAAERVSVGMPVRLGWEAVEGSMLPVFRPAEGGA